MPAPRCGHEHLVGDAAGQQRRAAVAPGSAPASRAPPRRAARGVPSTPLPITRTTPSCKTPRASSARRVRTRAGRSRRALRAWRGRAGRAASPTSGAASNASTCASVSVFGKRGGTFGRIEPHRRIGGDPLAQRPAVEAAEQPAPAGGLGAMRALVAPREIVADGSGCTSAESAVRVPSHVPKAQVAAIRFERVLREAVLQPHRVDETIDQRIRRWRCWRRLRRSLSPCPTGRAERSRAAHTGRLSCSSNQRLTSSLTRSVRARIHQGRGRRRPDGTE